MGAARLLLRTGWSWAELCETPADLVEAVIDELNRQAGQTGPRGAETGGEW